jgi:hypothetical protein
MPTCFACTMFSPSSRWSVVLMTILFGLPADSIGVEVGAEQVVIEQQFSQGLQDWWIEGDRSVKVTQGHLLVDADPPDGKTGTGCTVWYRKPLPQGDLRVEFDAHVVSSAVGANNINFFLCYSDPLGRSLFASREDRADGAYNRYHGMNGYIITFLRDSKHEGGKNLDGSAKARVRIRRCPGFQLLAETYARECETGRTYHVTITKRGRKIVFAVDGKTLLAADDPNPLQGGQIGLRTWRTKLWWDNVRVSLLDGP